MAAVETGAEIRAAGATGAGDRPGFSPYDKSDGVAMAFRAFAYANIGLLITFLINNFLIFWLGLPGVAPILGWAAGDAGALGWLQALLYPLVIVASIILATRDGRRALRADAARITSLNAYFIRSCFWAVLIIGLVDTTIMFLVVEKSLTSLTGPLAPLVNGGIAIVNALGGDYAYTDAAKLAQDLGRSQFRGPYVHVPLMAVGFLIGIRSRTLGFHWLATLVVVAELLIVFGRFIFSYEQAWMGDLVRFWYAALFLFASAYTLVEDGHVRVDVFYASFKTRTQGRVNAFGAILFGLTLCWVIILTGMWGKANVINAPVLAFETGQQSSGLQVKYILAAYICVFAMSMLMQFCAALLDGVADARGEAGHREGDHASVA
ncbi:MAG: TRAP transporter small permease subunit [Neomegalonema sp.]|nr:TRAP transporter small permease subunit [Neomegalonema sp.]